MNRIIIIITKILFLAISISGLFLYSRYVLPEGTALIGHDSGLPLDAKMFFESRLYAWDDRINFGKDNSHLFGSLIVHFIDYLSSLVVGTPYAGNWFNLFFWLSAMFVSAYFFGLYFKKYFGKVFPYIFPYLIVFNFFVFQSIFILERAKYSTMSSMLLLIPLITEAVVRGRKILFLSFCGALFYTIFNVGGLIGAPLYGGSILIFLGFFLYLLILFINNKDNTYFFRFLLFSFLFVLFSLLLNVYQILPFLPGLFDKQMLAHLGNRALVSSKDWVNYISQNTSFINIMRLHGIPSWYSGPDQIDINNPYSYLYLSNIFLKLASFLFPLLAFLALKSRKNDGFFKAINLFVIFFLLSIIFTAGTRSVFGGLYGILFDRFPGFNLFRTPFYKFGTLFCISYLALIAGSLSQFYEYLSKRKKSRFIMAIFPVLIIGFWLTYHFVLFKPDFIFSWKKGSGTNVLIPSYVYDFVNWSKDNLSSDSRMLLIPNINKVDFTDSYDWGYWSMSTLSYSLVNMPVLTNEVNMNQTEWNIANNIYDSFDKTETTRFLNFASRYSIRYLLYREDVVDKKDYSLILTHFIREGVIKHKATFGKWKIYEVLNSREDTLKLARNRVLIKTDSKLDSVDFLNNLNFALQGQIGSSKIESIANEKIYIFKCESCVIESISRHSKLPGASILPNSFFYKFLNKQSAQNIASLAESVSLRVSEARSMMALNTEQKFIDDTLSEVVEELKKINDLLVLDKTIINNFGYSKVLISFLLSPQANLQDFLKTSEFPRLGDKTRELVYETLWELYKVEKYFSPLLSNKNYYHSNKEYVITDVKPGNYKLLVQNIGYKLKSKELTPQVTGITINGLKEDALIFPEMDSNTELIEVKTLSIQNKSEQLKLRLTYSNPNIFSNQNMGILPTPRGEISCLTGSIDGFISGETYEITVRGNERGQYYLLLIDDYPEKVKGKGYPRYGFESQFVMDSISTPFTYFYRSREDSVNPQVHLCSLSKDEPNLAGIEIHELFSPVVILREENASFDKSGAKDIVPVYQKISPIKYRFILPKLNEPQWLIFNVKYSSFWVVSNKEDLNITEIIRVFKSKRDENHFLIRGYANAWYLSEDQEGVYYIHYLPQFLFKLGVMISLGVFIFALIFFILTRFRKNDKRK